MRDEVVSALLGALARPELTADAADRLSRYGNAIVPRLSQCLARSGNAGRDEARAAAGARAHRHAGRARGAD